MDHEPSEEVIKHQMQETRASLAEKLETLEQQVVGTVHSATSAVTDTVETVRGAVQQTVELAKSSVQDTVEAVKDTFDLSRHVRQHPWMMFGGSVGVGFAAGYLLERVSLPSRERFFPGAVPSLSGLASSRAEHDGGVGRRTAEESRRAAAAPASASEGLLGDMSQKFEGELHKLKGLALGALFGVVRDMITRSAPPQLSSPLAEILDSATVKVGGQPIHGSLLDAFGQGSTGQTQGRQYGYTAERSSTGPTAHNAATHAAGPID